MNKSKLFPTLLILLLAALPLLTACQSIIPAQAKAMEPQNARNNQSVDFDYEKAADIQAARWVAMARFYEENGLLNYHSNPDDLSAYRWLAMAKVYEQHGLLNDKMDPGDIMAFRWLAMARTYEKLGLLNQK